MLLSDGFDSVSIITDDNVTSIVIDAVNITSSGAYTCRASNVLGTDEQTYSIRVLSLGKSNIPIVLVAS